MKTVYCQKDKKLKDNFCQESGGLVQMKNFIVRRMKSWKITFQESGGGQAVNMKIGEVRVAEDSDFALLKVSINFKTIGKTIIF